MYTIVMHSCNSVVAGSSSDGQVDEGMLVQQRCCATHSSTDQKDVIQSVQRGRLKTMSK